MSEPRLSVIITTFNRPRLVQEAIESVLGQDAGPPFELIVVDDGFTGDTRDALQRFGRAIRYARQDNLGLNPARNHGLQLIQGDLDRAPRRRRRLAAVQDAHAAAGAGLLSGSRVRSQQLLCVAAGHRQASP